MAPTTRTGARRALFVDEATADEPSDVCARLNEADARARRKRRRSLDDFSFLCEEDGEVRTDMAVFTTLFAIVFCEVIDSFTIEEEEEDADVSTEEEVGEKSDDVCTGKEEKKDDDDDDDDDDVCIGTEEDGDGLRPDADLLEHYLRLLKRVKALIDHDLGPDNVICDEVLDYFEQDLDIDHIVLSTAHEMFASKDRKFRSLMALPVDMREKWLLIHTRKL